MDTFLKDTGLINKVCKKHINKNPSLTEDLTLLQHNELTWPLESQEEVN